MDYSELAKGHLDVVVENKIATVTMNRPERLNAFGDGLHEALEEFLHMVNYDSDVNVAVLTGAGRAFTAGGDVKAMNDRAAGGATPRSPTPRGRSANERRSVDPWWSAAGGRDRGCTWWCSQLRR